MNRNAVVSHADVAEALQMIGGAANAVQIVATMFGATAEDVAGSDMPVAGILRAFERGDRIELELRIAGEPPATLVIE